MHVYITIYKYHAGASISKLGADVRARAAPDKPNYYIMNTEFNFTEDGSILGWVLWAQNVGRARLQVMILHHEMLPQD